MGDSREPAAVDHFQRVSQAPTRPAVRPGERSFDVAALYRGPADAALPAGESAGAEAGAAPALPLHEKLRQAYYWVTNSAIISPFYDIEFNEAAPRQFALGDAGVQVTLPTDQSYSSYVLLPLLNLAARRRCLLVGGPGRGKTAIALLMGVLGGYTLPEIKRAVQHGQPQMTIADLLGNPLPSSLVSATEMDQVVIAWRAWLGMRVKIIDEYNRIPTRTQSALLTVMADNYAEMYDQVYQCPEAAWYLTANDDAGGGTYQVIEALRDRIDVVVRALHFNTRFLGELLLRIEAGVRPEEVVPPQIIFSEAELERAQQEILAVRLPPPLRRRLEFFASQFELFEPAARKLEYLTKDTVKLSGVEWHTLGGEAGGKDALADLGAQTRCGLSVRAMMTALIYVKALAYFRGHAEVELQDMRQILPFVLQDKLVQNPDSPVFEQPEQAPLRVDHISWVRGLFDGACAEYDRLDLDRTDEVGALLDQLDEGLEGLSEREVRRRLTRVERALTALAKGGKLYGHLFDDVLALKYAHQRYTNYLRWLRWRG